MFVTAKTVITVYGKLKRYADSVEDMIRKAAHASFGDSTPCEVQIERIAALIEKKNLIVNLKVITDKALASLKREEVEILASKYGKMEKPVYYSRRTYFRRLNTSLRSFELALEANGLNGDAFEDYVLKLPFLSVTKEFFERKTSAELKRAQKLKLNGTFRVRKGSVNSFSPVNHTLTTNIATV